MTVMQVLALTSIQSFSVMEVLALALLRDIIL